MAPPPQPRLGPAPHACFQLRSTSVPPLQAATLWPVLALSWQSCPYRPVLPSSPAGGAYTAWSACPILGQACLHYPEGRQRSLKYDEIRQNLLFHTEGPGVGSREWTEEQHSQHCLRLRVPLPACIRLCDSAIPVSSTTFFELRLHARILMCTCHLVLTRS